MSRNRFYRDCDSLHKVHDILNTTSSVMTVMSYTWILKFVWICLDVLTDVLDTVDSVWLELENWQVLIVNIECIYMHVHSGYADHAKVVEKWWCLKTSCCNLFQGSFHLSGTNSLRQSEATWQQEHWHNWPMSWHDAWKRQAITWNNDDFLSINTSVTNSLCISVEVQWHKVSDVLDCSDFTELHQD